MPDHDWVSNERRETSMEVGRLIQAMETLTEEVNLLRTKMESIDGQMNRGKGMMVGLFLAAGGVGAGVSSMFNKLFGNQ